MSRDSIPATSSQTRITLRRLSRPVVSNGMDPACIQDDALAGAEGQWNLAWAEQDRRDGLHAEARQ
jgi:hypothetical protein